LEPLNLQSNIKTVINIKSDLTFYIWDKNIEH